MTPTLRDYQQNALDAILQARLRGILRQLVALPTGGGKTIIFVYLAMLLNIRTIILVHRDELLRQAVDKLQAVWPDADIGIVKAQQDDFRHQIVIASVQTLAHQKRRARLAGEGFELCIIDECHHSTSDSYRAILGDLGFLSDEPDKLLVGVTATPFRADGSALADIFQGISYRIGILDLIERGHLVDPKGFLIETDVSLSGVHTRQGDFVTGELAKAVNTPARNKLVVEKYHELTPGRKAVVFSVDVQHAIDLSEMFTAAGVPSAFVHGETPSDERRETLAAFERGDILALCNCAILTEGWDCPSVSAVIMARPTRSRVLYTQCVGRGLRPAPGKTDCIIFDFGDRAHDLLGLPDLLGDDKPRDRKQGDSLKDMADAKKQEDADEQERKRQAEEERKRWAEAQRIRAVRQFEMNLLGGTKWQQAEAGEWRYPLTKQSWATLTPTHDGLYSASLITPSGIQSIAENEDLGIAQKIAVERAKAYHDAAFGPQAKWRYRNEPPTEPQLKMLKRLGYAGASPQTKGEASALIDRIKNGREVSV